MFAAQLSEQSGIHQANLFAWSFSNLNSKLLITSVKKEGKYIWLLIYTLFVQWTCSVVSFHTILLYYCVNVLTAQSHTSALRVEGDSCVLLVLSSGPIPSLCPPPFFSPSLTLLAYREHSSPVESCQVHYLHSMPHHISREKAFSPLITISMFKTCLDSQCMSKRNNELCSLLDDIQFAN